MNDYVILDGYRYAAPFMQFEPRRQVPQRQKYTLGGTLDVTYGPANPLFWEGKLKVPVSVTDSDVYGDIGQFRLTIVKKIALAFTDHEGDVFTIHLSGVHHELPKVPVVDSVQNTYYIPVRITRATGP